MAPGLQKVAPERVRGAPGQGRPGSTSSLVFHVFLPRGEEIANHATVNPLNRSFSVVAKLHFAYNFCGIEETKLASDMDVETEVE